MAALTVYADVIMPESVIAAGVRGKQIRNNTRTQSPSGYARVNINSARSLLQFEIGVAPLPVSTWATLGGMYEVTHAGAYGFLMRDPKDSVATSGLMYPYNAALLGTIGFGYGVPQYKLYNRYTSVGSTRTYDRAITRPKASPALTRAGSSVTLGASPGNASVDTTTGTVTFVADSSSTVTAVTVGATTQVTLTAALSGIAVGGRLYLSGLTGADAALLNGLSHSVTAITGGGLNIYTLATDTATKTITAAGSGYKYPQPTEALAWSGIFYVPVHFAEDTLDFDIIRGGPADTRYVAGPRIVLNEVRE